MCTPPRRVKMAACSTVPDSTHEVALWPALQLQMLDPHSTETLSFAPGDAVAKPGSSSPRRPRAYCPEPWTPRQLGRCQQTQQCNRAAAQPPAPIAQIRRASCHGGKGMFRVWSSRTAALHHRHWAPGKFSNCARETKHLPARLGGLCSTAHHSKRWSELRMPLMSKSLPRWVSTALYSWLGVVTSSTAGCRAPRMAWPRRLCHTRPMRLCGTVGRCQLNALEQARASCKTRGWAACCG